MNNEPANRHEQRKIATHQRLLDAARAVIIEKGYDNVEILDITDRADVSKATFYKHFPNKEECVREMMVEGFDALVEHIFTREQSAATRQQWALDSIAEVFSWAKANRELLLIMVGGAASSRLNAFGRQYMVDISLRMNARFTFENEQTRYPPMVTAQVVTGVMVQLLGWWLEEDTGFSARQMAEMIQDILQTGLGQILG